MEQNQSQATDQQYRYTLAFENGVAAMTLDELKRTLRFEQAKGGLPRAKPIEHFKLIENICESIEKTVGIAAQVDTIYAAEGSAKRIMWTGDKDHCPIEQYLVERIVAKIHVNQPEDSETNAAIAISYNERGITVAFGMNVRICSNMNIYGNDLFSTYGSSSVTYEQGLELLAHWLQNFTAKKGHYMKIIQQLGNKTVDPDDVYMIIGKLFHAAVVNNMGDKSINAPLNVTQCGKFVQEYRNLIKKADKKEINAWDVTNNITSVLKPANADLSKILECNRMVNNFVARAFGIDPEPEEEPIDEDTTMKIETEIPSGNDLAGM